MMYFGKEVSERYSYVVQQIEMVKNENHLLKHVRLLIQIRALTHTNENLRKAICKTHRPVIGKQAIGLKHLR